jgi:hypothetical protein
LETTLSRALLSSLAFVASANDWQQPDTWHEYRLLVWLALTALLLFIYRSVWASYRSLFRLHRDSALNPAKPPLSPLEAVYLYSQQPKLSFLVWLIEACQSGLLSLRYQKGTDPWSLQRTGTGAPQAALGRGMLATLFAKGDQLRLTAGLSGPNQAVAAASRQLFEHVENSASSLIRHRPSSLPGWLLLAATLAEMPLLHGPKSLLYMAPALAFVGFTALPLFGLTKVLPSFLKGSNLLLYSAGGVFLLIAGVVHWSLLTASFTGPYFTLYFFPVAAAVIGVLVQNSPVAPKDPYLMSQVVGYQRYLGQALAHVEEQDLAWSLGLEVDSELLGDGLRYHGERLPEWLVTEEDDVQSMIRRLHLELPAGVQRALYGPLESSHRRGLSSVENRL